MAGSRLISQLIIVFSSIILSFICYIILDINWIDTYNHHTLYTPTLQHSHTLDTYRLVDRNHTIDLFSCHRCLRYELSDSHSEKMEVDYQCSCLVTYSGMYADSDADSNTDDSDSDADDSNTDSDADSGMYSDADVYSDVCGDGVNGNDTYSGYICGNSNLNKNVTIWRDKYAPSVLFVWQESVSTVSSNINKFLWSTARDVATNCGDICGVRSLSLDISVLLSSGRIQPNDVEVIVDKAVLVALDALASLRDIMAFEFTISVTHTTYEDYKRLQSLVDSSISSTISLTVLVQDSEEKGNPIDGEGNIVVLDAGLLSTGGVYMEQASKRLAHSLVILVRRSVGLSDSYMKSSLWNATGARCVQVRGDVIGADPDICTTSPVVVSSMETSILKLVWAVFLHNKTVKTLHDIHTLEQTHFFHRSSSYLSRVDAAVSQLEKAQQCWSGSLGETSLSVVENVSRLSVLNCAVDFLTEACNNARKVLYDPVDIENPRDGPEFLSALLLPFWLPVAVPLLYGTIVECRRYRRLVSRKCSS